MLIEVDGQVLFGGEAGETDAAFVLFDTEVVDLYVTTEVLQGAVGLFAGWIGAMYVHKSARS